MQVWGSYTREELEALVGQLAQANAELQQVLGALRLVNQEQQARIVRLEQEVERLKSGPAAPKPPQPPPFVKPNRKTQEERRREATAQQPKKPRKRRPHGFARLRQEPTQVTRVVAHHPKACSRCGRRFGEGAGSKHASRQIIELPVAPIEVIEHQFFACRCGVCGHRTLERADLSAQAPGKSRLGVRLMSLIAYLDVVCRLPVRTTQRLLEGVYGLHLSEGGLVRVSHAVSQAGQGAYEELLREVRRSRVLHADETGARENGINGYAWALCTSDARYYHRDGSRGAAVIQRLLGYDPEVLAARSPAQARLARQTARERRRERGEPEPLPFHGGLESDFYGAYDWYPGVQQKCTTHLVRDVHELKSQHPDDPALWAWAGKAQDVVRRATDYANQQRQAPAHLQHGQALRAKKRRAFEREMDALARPYLKSTGPCALPQRVLAERLHKYRHRLFPFVEHLELSPDNNAAERSIRPLVVLRKVSGGTRSEKGSRTQDVLLSLFGTWHLRGLDLLQACQQMLVRSTAPAPG